MLSLDQWRGLAAEHRARAEVELPDVIRRRSRGELHPVDDFLFEYYNLRPSHLLRWHPGVGVAVEDDGSWPAPTYASAGGKAMLDAGHFVGRRSRTIATALGILRSTAANAPRFGCFGMHEWAMVYGLEQHETRHPQLPLRFPPDELAAIVESVGCRCSHYDAFRFFTPAARPLNIIAPTRERQPELDQPGCLHANMDLYKWASKLVPAVPTDLLWETFLLAREIRVVDMRASAYDLADWGFEPIRVETSEGRAEYARLQRGFADRARPLRERVITVLQRLGACAPDSAKLVTT